MPGWTEEGDASLGHTEALPPPTNFFNSCASTENCVSMSDREDEWRRGHKPRLRALGRRSYVKNREKVRAYGKQYRTKIRMKILSHYGGSPPKCARCGYTDFRALTIDHIEGGGGKHYQNLGGSGFYFHRWIIQNNFPPGLQILCMNCQWIKRWENKETDKPLKYPGEYIAPPLPAIGYEEEIAQITRFLDEECNKDPSVRGFTDDVYDAYCEWCKKTSQKETLTRVLFGKIMLRKVKITRDPSSRKGRRFYIGLAVKGREIRLDERSNLKGEKISKATRAYIEKKRANPPVFCEIPGCMNPFYIMRGWIGVCMDHVNVQSHLSKEDSA